MTAYTVYKITMVDTRSLLFIQAVGTNQYMVSVYDEHTGQTLMRQAEPTVPNLQLALTILSTGAAPDF